MDHEQFQRLMLDQDWTALALEQAAAAHAHTQTCAECARTLKEYDELRAVLGKTEADETPDGGWGAYENRLKDRVIPNRRATRWWSGGAAIAALLLMGVGIWQYNSLIREAAATPPQALLPPNPEQQASVFQSVSQVFDGKAGWMVMSNGESNLGLMSKPLPDGTRLVLLRLTMSQQEEIVAQTDVAILAGQQANISVPMGNQVVNYRMMPNQNEPKRVAIWAEIESAPQTAPLDVVATNLDMRRSPVVRAGMLSAYELNVGYREMQLERIH